MRRLAVVFVAAACGVAGFAAGFAAAVRLFAVDVDLQAKYVNQPVRVTRDVTVTQGAVRVVVPAGAIVTHARSSAGERLYALEFVSHSAMEPVDVQSDAPRSHSWNSPTTGSGPSD